MSEYWFIDPDAESVRVYRGAGERFAAPIDFTADDGHAIETPLLPGLLVSLVDVFRR